MGEVVERAARAMYESDMHEEYGLAGSYHSWESLRAIEPQQYEIREYRSRARAAIVAIADAVGDHSRRESVCLETALSFHVVANWIANAALPESDETARKGTE